MSRSSDIAALSLWTRPSQSGLTATRESKQERLDAEKQLREAKDAREKRRKGEKGEAVESAEDELGPEKIGLEETVDGLVSVSKGPR